MRAAVVAFSVGTSVLSLSCEKPPQPAKESTATTTRPTPDTALVQRRADWEAFRKSLARDPQTAAAALERYRVEHGLPFQFYYDEKSPVVLAGRVKTEDTEMCGRVAQAFVRRMPVGDALLSISPIIEYDSTGHVLRKWPLSSGVEFAEIVVGVSGDELVAELHEAPTGVFMRVKPNGEYHVSAEAPQSLPPEEWIALEDSTWVRVKPDMGMSMHSMFTRGVNPGTWTPRGDSGWYVRTDSGPQQGTVAHSITLPRQPNPPMPRCPPSKEFDGMLCRGFPDGARIRTIAVPAPCT
jgi:hypothetical protein